MSVKLSIHLTIAHHPSALPRRFLFFPDSADVTSPIDALAKSDKKAFNSVSAVLHLKEETAAGGRISDLMFDVREVKTKQSANRRRH